MRSVDAQSAALDVDVRTLMERAGRGVADAICARFSPRPISVLCGPGNNGGDGWVAARLLAQRGWPVHAETLVEREALLGAARDAAFAYQGEIRPLNDNLSEAALFVDAMFGAGLSRPLEGAAARIASQLRARAADVVAVDLPSGLNGDGIKSGGAHAAAALTVTFVRKRPVHVLAAFAEHVGEVMVAKIGAPAAALAAQDVRLWENDPALWAPLFPWPGRHAHKHRRGHVMVMSGPAHATGAARLAAYGALRMGAGLVTVLSAPSALMVNASHLTAIMLARVESAEEIAARAAGATSVVIGPAAGVSVETAAALRALLAGPAPLVIDADALTVLAEAPMKLRAGDVCTPHVGEFERLFPGLLASAPTRIQAVCTAAQRIGAVVLLKGPDTLIAAPDGRAIVNICASPFLATAGSGDVLAGFIAGLVGQGMAAFDAAATGAWLHGRLGRALGPGLIAEDLAEHLPKLLNQLAPEALRAQPLSAPGDAYF